MENDIQELESYILFQEINDTFTLFSSLIKIKNNNLHVKETFVVTEDSKFLLNDGYSEKDIELLLKWFQDKKLSLLENITKCITLSNENFAKFKAENPAIKEELKAREKDLKRATRLLENLNLENPGYYEFDQLQKGPVLESDYAGISVKVTNYFLI